MIQLISIELTNQTSVTISDPTAQDLADINYWLDYGTKFYGIRSKGKIERVNKDHVVKMTIYE